jgi:two-component system CheB/CheR fusion protein
VPPTPAAEYSDSAARDGAPFPIVGVGASAGGLEAFTELLQSLPEQPGLAFLFVQHLEPYHKSQLKEILTKVTPLRVQEVSEGMPVQANQVYLIPPGVYMALSDGALTLRPRPTVPGQNMPIDHLFRSLAEVQKSRAIGVLLSGGGTDGTLDFQAIKAEGGITFAQDERTARQSSMPRSAIADGHVDYILPPRDIAGQLARITRHPYALEPTPAVDRPTADAMHQILSLLRLTTEVDFSHYKPTTVQRRIRRRMALREVESVPQYVELLRRDTTELHTLYQDLLIRVTQFFRDPEAFEALKARVFPLITKGRTAEMPIRLWVAGCATGEEVYSLAIALLEFLGSRLEIVPVKILATDLNEYALEKARAGSYVDNIEIDVSPERLRRFFRRTDGHYQISKAVRDLCVFSRHNMASDPPFSRLDLISCRNVLIYLDSTLQKRILPMLHYALNPHGFLFLGSSESIGPFGDLFDTVDGKHRIFVKKMAPSGLALDLSLYTAGASERLHGVRVEGTPPMWTALDVQREADRIVLGRYAPVGVVIDENGTVLQFRGRTHAYLEPAPGMASLDLLKMLRPGLLAEVRAIINEAKVEDAPTAREGLRVQDGEEFRPIRVEVLPFKIVPSGARFFLGLFPELPQP